MAQAVYLGKTDSGSYVILHERFSGLRGSSITWHTESREAVVFYLQAFRWSNLLEDFKVFNGMTEEHKETEFREDYDPRSLDDKDLELITREADPMRIRPVSEV